MAEYALQLMQDSAGLVDDSDGELGATMSRAADIHLAACAAGEPDPGRLAEFLVGTALGSDHELFLDALPDYADVLGPDGMARYRELVERAWRDLPPKQPHDYRAGRFAVTHLMEQLADVEGGTDALIEVLARDVASGYDVLRTRTSRRGGIGRWRCSVSNRQRRRGSPTGRTGNLPAARTWWRCCSFRPLRPERRLPLLPSRAA